MRIGQEEMCLREDAAVGGAENVRGLGTVFSSLVNAPARGRKTKVAHVWVKSSVTGLGPLSQGTLRRLGPSWNWLGLLRLIAS